MPNPASGNKLPTALVASRERLAVAGLAIRFKFGQPGHKIALLLGRQGFLQHFVDKLGTPMSFAPGVLVRGKIVSAISAMVAAWALVRKNRLPTLATLGSGTGQKHFGQGAGRNGVAQQGRIFSAVIQS